MLEEEKLKIKHQFNERKTLLEEKFKIEHDNQMQELEAKMKQ